MFGNYRMMAKLVLLLQQDGKHFPVNGHI